MFKSVFLFTCILFFYIPCTNCGNDKDGYCDKDGSCGSTLKNKRFLLYDINPGEGFNLRRDVYMRLAVLAKKLRWDANWILVLPPWGRIYHWKSKDIGNQIGLLWSMFFDIKSLSDYTPVMEFADFVKEYGNTLDQVFYLQHFVDAWKSGNWEEKVEETSCNDKLPYRWNNNAYEGWFWGFPQIKAKNVTCVSVQGHASILIPKLEESGAAVMLDRGEIVLHDTYGDSEYWRVRRSMRFASRLYELANEFRLSSLNSNDETDNTLLLPDWKNEKKTENYAKGGPYLCAHLRRQDFVYSRPAEVPSVRNAAEQLANYAVKFNLSTIFIASDAAETEIQELRNTMKDYLIEMFQPSQNVKTEIKDGGVAIVDQIICSKAKLFIGTHESTFTFRIQEEREILGFHPDVTFNRLCGDGKPNCEPPSRWRIVY